MILRIVQKAKKHINKFSNIICQVVVARGHLKSINYINANIQNGFQTSLKANFYIALNA